MDKNTMIVTNDNNLWIAIRIQRGFVSQVKAYIDEGPARRQEKRWRRIMNPDYDETSVAPVHIIGSGRVIPHKSLLSLLPLKNVRLKYPKKKP